MKKFMILITVIVAALAGCKTQQQTSTVAYDDVYSSPKHSKQPAEVTRQNVDLSAPQQISTPDSSSGLKSGSATWYDDYNDYSKSSQTQNLAGSQGNAVDPNLYDNSYSASPDVNVYVGSSYDPFFWGSSVSIGCGWGWGWDSYWGYPYSSWYYPYYGYYPYSYWGWGGYSNGYWDGYHDGYWDGQHGNPYYNTYSSFYGQRRMLSSSGEGNSHRIPRTIEPGTSSSLSKTPRNIDGQRESKITETSSSTRFPDQRKIEGNTARQERINPGERTQKETGTRGEANKTPADRQHYKYERIKQNQGAVNERNGNTNPAGRGNTKREAPSPKYSRTEGRTPSTRAVETQNYSSPAYRQPKYSQEYINPRTQETRNTGTRESNVQRKGSSGAENGVQGRTQPASGKRSYVTPSGSNNSTKSYSTPSRSGSSSGYSSPSRSYSTPSSSGSRSGGGGSYSAPSRSGGSSGSSGGGSSSGGGGRRK